MRTIMPAFGRHAEAARIIGHIVTGYGELEFNLAWDTAWLTKHESIAFKVMFRGPGEMQRILMADALVRERLSPGKLRTRWEQAIAGLHHCRKIRNQYAHCQWGDDARGLWFVALEEIANEHETFDLTALSRHVVDVELVREQEDYFCFVMDSLNWLALEGQVLVGRLQSNPHPEVHRSESPPKLHN